VVEKISLIQLIVFESIVIAKTLLLQLGTAVGKEPWRWKVEASEYIRDMLALRRDIAIRLAIKFSEATSIPVSCEPYWCGSPRFAKH